MNKKLFILLVIPFATLACTNNKVIFNNNETSETNNQNEEETQNVDEKDKELETILEYQLNKDGKSYGVKGLYVNDHVHIPDSYNGRPITCINNEGFEYVKTRTYTFPNHLEQVGMFSFAASGIVYADFSNTKLSYINQMAFNCCTKLEYVILPNTLSTIDSYTFWHNKKLELINLEETSIKEISPCCFSDCISIKEINVPNCLDSLGSRAFYNCNSLETVNLSNSNLNIINKECFKNCLKLKHLYLPTSLTNIMEKAFEHCESLEEITYSGTKEQWLKIEKVDSYKDYCPLNIIHCSDGDLII